MNNKVIMEYLIGEIGESQTIAQNHANGFARNPDIESEFVLWIQTRKFPENPIKVQGYSAEDICKISPLIPVGAYNFLITLREHTEFALADIRAGFPKR